LITITINTLFKEFNSLSEKDYNNTFIIIQFKIKIINDQYRSISRVQYLKLTKIEDLIDIFLRSAEQNIEILKTEDYYTISNANIFGIYIFFFFLNFNLFNLGNFGI
jgi:hypothetical protein